MKLLLATLVVGIAMNGFGVNAASMHTPEAETKAASCVSLASEYAPGSFAVCALDHRRQSQLLQPTHDPKIGRGGNCP